MLRPTLDGIMVENVIFHGQILSNYCSQSLCPKQSLVMAATDKSTLEVGHS